MTAYVYRYLAGRSPPYTTGFYSPDGEWTPDKDFVNQDDAAWRVHFLNGGSATRATPALQPPLLDIARSVARECNRVADVLDEGTEWRTVAQLASHVVERIKALSDS
jgi:hypothetical protein